MKRMALLLLPCLLALSFALPEPASAAKGTREERVRKFQDSLGQEVVRDSGGPVPAGERSSLLRRTGLIAAGGILLLFGIHLLAAKIRERRRILETVRRYETENLMTPDTVRSHLRRVADARIPVSAWIDDHFIRFSTRIDAVEAGRSACGILPLSPAAGNGMIRGSGRLRLEYMFQKVPYHFDSAWIGERQEGGTFLHVVSFPDRIHFLQRREYYRIEPALSGRVTCTADRADFPPMTVLDIGMGGVAVAASARLRPGEILERCRIGGGNLLPMEVSAKVAYELSLSDGKSRFAYRYGLRFTRLGAGSDRRLAYFMSKQQIADLSRRKSMER